MSEKFTVDPEVILFERELASRHVLDYVRYVFKYIYKKPFFEAWYHEYLAAVMEDYLAGKIPLLLISLPPSYSKTEFCVKCPISFKMGKDHQFSNMYVSYGDTLSTETSTDIREVMEHPAYKALFPTVQFKKSKDTHWSIKGGGGLFATTPTSATTGFHTKNIVIDDPIKTMEGHVKSSLEKVIDFWDTTIQSRLDDWGDDTGSIMVVMQRQDEKDLVGHLLATRKDAVYICLEAYITEPKVYEWGEFRYERAAYEPLHEQKHSMDKLEQMERAAPTVFATQYQQNPKRDNVGFFTEKEDIHYIAERDIPDQELYIIVDNAEGLKTTNDNRAVGVLGYSVDFDTKRELFVLHDLSFGIYDEDKTMEEIIRFMIKFETDVYIENKAAGITLARLLIKKIVEVNAKLRSKGEAIIKNEVHTFSPKRSVTKRQKIMAGKNYTKSGYFRISTECDKLGVQQLISECKKFDPNNVTNDDNCLDVSIGAVTLDFMESKETGKPSKESKSDHEDIRKRKKKKTWRC